MKSDLHILDLLVGESVPEMSTIKVLHLFEMMLLSYQAALLIYKVIYWFFKSSFFVLYFQFSSGGQAD